MVFGEYAMKVPKRSFAIKPESFTSRYLESSKFGTTKAITGNSGTFEKMLGYNIVYL